MSRTKRLLLYLCTALLTCFLWRERHCRSGPARTAFRALPSPPAESGQYTYGGTNVSALTKDGTIDLSNASYDSGDGSDPELQRTLAWQAEQQRRKKALRLACREWHPTAEEYLPKNKIDLQYLLVDDRHKALYCYVPKVSCTTWKRLWMILIGLRRGNNPLDIPEEVPHLMHKHMMLVKQPFNNSVLQEKLSSYTKLLVVRDPYERLLSAYRDKLESGKNKVYEDKIKSQTRKNGDTHEGVITFSEFVSFVISLPHNNIDEHWMPYHQLCFPCALKYDVIAKYETLTEDSERFLRLIGAPDNLHFPPYSPGNTSSLLPQYMAGLTQHQRNGLYRMYQRDFEAFEYLPYGGSD